MRFFTDNFSDMGFDLRCPEKPTGVMVGRVRTETEKFTKVDYINGNNDNRTLTVRFKNSISEELAEKIEEHFEQVFK